MKFNIRNKIIFVFVAALVLANVLNLFFITSIVKKDYNTSLYSELVLLGDNLRTQLLRITALGIATHDIEGFNQQCLELVRKYEHLTQAMIVDSQGTVVFHNLDSQKGRTLDISMVREAIRLNKIDVFPVSENDNLFFYAVLPYGDKPGYSNEYAVVICSSSNVINGKIYAMIKNCSFVIVLTSVVGTAGLFIFLSCFVNDRKKICDEIIIENNCEDRDKDTGCQQTPPDIGVQWQWETDMNGLYTYSSPEVENLLGYKPEEIVGKKHFYDLFLAQERETMKIIAFDRFAEKLSFEDFLNANLHKSGRIVWLMTKGSPIIDEDGCLLGYRGVDINFNDRKKYVPSAVGSITCCATNDTLPC
ncbi:MAG: PAS fold protein [Planctomycetes bacterium ADurb.Bin401]|nr:MAG: PAS fold protein [Planctomycetes bacterium ADurb.Bin401]